MTKELSIVEGLELVPFFTKGESVGDILAVIEKEALSHVPDVSTAKGRSAIKATVTKVVSSKTHLEKHGKLLAAEYKAIPKQIDANRKKCKDFLDDLKDKVRQPLTDWEDEQARIKAEEAARAEAERVKAEVDADHELALLMYASHLQDLAKQKEAERLRLEKEAAEQAEREKLIAEQAADRAKQEAEAAARAEQERVEREKQEAIEAERRAKWQTEKAEQDRLSAIEQAKKDKVEAEQRAKWASEQAEKKRIADVEAARLAEVARQERFAAAEAAERAEREANKKHVNSVRRAAIDSIKTVGVDEDTAKEIIKAIHKGLVPNVQINY